MKIIRQGLVGKFSAMGRAAVVTLIEGKNLEGAGEYLTQRAPVFERAKQPMQNDEGVSLP